MSARPIPRVPVQVCDVERVALRPSEAARALGISRDTFDRYCRDELRWIRLGRLRLLPVDELRRWAEKNAARLLPDTWDAR